MIIWASILSQRIQKDYNWFFDSDPKRTVQRILRIILRNVSKSLLVETFVRFWFPYLFIILSVSEDYVCRYFSQNSSFRKKTCSFRNFLLSWLFSWQKVWTQTVCFIQSLCRQNLLSLRRSMKCIMIQTTVQEEDDDIPDKESSQEVLPAKRGSRRRRLLDTRLTTIIFFSAFFSFHHHWMHPLLTIHSCQSPWRCWLSLKRLSSRQKWSSSIEYRKQTTCSAFDFQKKKNRMMLSYHVSQSNLTLLKEE